MRSDFDDRELYGEGDSEMSWTDAEIKRRHGDDKAHPIAVWRKEFNSGETTLAYIDWRADRKYYATRK